MPLPVLSHGGAVFFEMIGRMIWIWIWIWIWPTAANIERHCWTGRSSRDGRGDDGADGLTRTMWLRADGWVCRQAGSTPMMGVVRMIDHRCSCCSQQRRLGQKNQTAKLENRPRHVVSGVTWGKHIWRARHHGAGHAARGGGGQGMQYHATISWG